MKKKISVEEVVSTLARVLVIHFSVRGNPNTEAYMSIVLLSGLGGRTNSSQTNGAMYLLIASFQV
jgi:hypothetical protein